MIKYFCDRCGKEIKEETTLIPIYAYDGKGVKLLQFGVKHICEDCAKKLEDIRDNLLSKHYEQDFLQMTDEDIELLRYTFKVGDKVITDDGRTGTITSICDCEGCKKRGFYGPDVEMNVGVDRIWITDADKENGFANFYQIGEHVFGNVDAEASKHIRERIIKLKHEVVEYEAQLNMMKKLENNDEI